MQSRSAVSAQQHLLLLLGDALRSATREVDGHNSYHEVALFVLFACFTVFSAQRQGWIYSLSVVWMVTSLLQAFAAVQAVLLHNYVRGVDSLHGRCVSRRLCAEQSAFAPDSQALSLALSLMLLKKER